MFCLIFANLDDSNGWPLVLEEAVMPTEPQPLPYDIKKLNEFHYKEPFVASRSVILNLHCDQIGRFFKVLGYNFVCKRSPNIWWLLGLTSLFNKKTCRSYSFQKVGQSRPLFVYFRSFSNKQYKFYNKYIWKNVHPISGARIRTHNFLIMSLLL